MSKIEDLRIERKKLTDEMHALLDKENFGADEEASYAKLENRFDEVDKMIDRMERQEARENALNQPTTTPITNMPTHQSAPAARNSEEYNKAFLNFIRTKGAVKNALQEGTNSEGGYLVPTEFEKTLYVAREKVDPIFEIAGRLTLGALEKNVPYVASEGVAALIAEEGSYGATDDAFAQVVFHAYKFGRIELASDELIADSAFDIQSYLATSLGKAIGKAQAGYFWTGTGSSQPQGVMTAAGTGVTTASSTAITADEVLDLFFSLPEEYRANATFAMHTSTLKAIRKLKLSGTGEYLWNPGLNGLGNTIMGRPYVTSSNIEEIAAGKSVMAFGDFEECYKIADRQGTNVKILNELYAATGQVGFRGDARSDGRGILASTGIKTMVMKSA